MGRRVLRLADLLGRAAVDVVRVSFWALLACVGLSVVIVLGAIGGVLWAIEHTLARLHL